MIVRSDIMDNLQNSDETLGPETLFNNILVEFNLNNPEKGYIRFQVTTAQETLPIVNATVTVSKSLGDDYFFAKVLYSDENGQTANLALPTPSRQSSQTPGSVIPYSFYDVRVTELNYKTVEVYSIPIFQGTTSIQPIRMNLALKIEDKLVVEKIDGSNLYDL